MTYPLEVGGVILWHGDVESQLKRLHGVTIKELGYDRRALAERYYAGDSVFGFIDHICGMLGLPERG